MEHTIAGLVKVEKVGQRLSSEDEVRLNTFLDSLLDKISACIDVVSARELLDQLGRFQTDLATACFKWRVSLSLRLMICVREFDRADDPDLRLYVFQKIKTKEFCVNTCNHNDLAD